MPQTKKACRPIFAEGRSALDEQGNITGLQSFTSTRNRSPVYCQSSQFNVEKVPEKYGRFPKLAKAEGTKKQGFCKIIVTTLFLVLLYYLSSIGLTFYQKWLLKACAIVVLKLNSNH